jgi:outer membrane protein assembly factor BamD
MKHRPSLLYSMLAVALGLGMVGCKSKPKVGPQVAGRSATTLLADGEKLLKEGRWEDGRRTLRLIQENMPSSPEFAKAELLLGDSYFFANKTSYPEAAVEYRNFLNYFPRHEMRDYALYHIALCHYAAIPDAERDQAETRIAISAFQDLLRESPGSLYAVDAKAKITQCWRRLAESELMVGIFYVRSRNYSGAETRIRELLETYPEYADRERAYYYLGEAMRQKVVPPSQIDQIQKDFLARANKDDTQKLSADEKKQLSTEIATYTKAELAKYRQEAADFFNKLVESYPNGPWAKLAKKSLSELGKEKKS